jgi:negative regulator of replication initiation
MVRFHQVEVDDEVFELVKAHAEPLVDTFNSALRRLLPLKDSGVHKAESFLQEEEKVVAAAIVASVPKHIPQALRHVLEVAQLVRSGGYTRTAATQYVARLHNVFPQTVLDKYCRQLGLRASRFDQLLEQSDLSELRGILKLKFQEHGQAIDEVLK